MGRKSKKDRPPAIIQGVFADNVRKLRDRRYADLPDATAMNEALAKDAETTLSQMQRILAQAVCPGIDMVERLATALEVRPQDLLTPYFGNSRTLELPQDPFTETSKPPKDSPRK